MVNEICNNLPCPECRQHAMSLMKRANKFNILKTKNNLEVFLFDFHNLVNKQKGYRIFNQEDYNFKYKTIDIREVIINFFNIFNLSTRNNNLMMETFHRQRFIQKFMQWIQTNKTKFV